MTDSERLNEVIKHYNKTANSFGRFIGLANSQKIYDILKGRNGISKDLAEIIKAKCLGINTGWLLTGEGTMLKENPVTSNINNKDSMNKIFEMYQRGEIYPAIVVKEKDEKINSLYKEIAILEEKVKELETLGKKANVQEDNNAECADAE